MAYEKLILLAPCHGLEDFPLYHVGEDAESLLACWTSLWHPLFLDSSKQLPRVERCDYPPEDLANALLLLPKPCEAELEADLPEKATAQNARLIRDVHNRAEILKLAVEPYAEKADRIDEELARDFLALGYAYLTVEVLTQQMRYASSIDESRIKGVIKEAAAAAIEGNADLCREKLTSCHDILADERSHYYPVDAFFVDLTLLATADATLGKSLDRQLCDEIPQNFIASGEAIEKLANTNKSALRTLRGKLEDGSASLSGGEFAELPLALMSIDAIVEQLTLGRAAYQRHVGHAPTCFARRGNGIFPSLAHVLRNQGFQSALHIKFDEGKMPESSQGRTKWMVGGREALDAYARAPLDATAHETFLNLPSHLSETMDSDHVATRMFIHWPGHVAPWYGDLRRCSRYGTALGKFVTLQEYFHESALGSNRDDFSADDYVYPFLRQAATPSDSDSISAWPVHWRTSVAQSAQQGTLVLASCLGKVSDPARAADVIQESISVTNENVAAKTIINPFSFPRRIRFSTNRSVTASGSNVYASEARNDSSTVTLVDVPAMGFACVRFDGKSDPITGPDLGEEFTLSNEFFQAVIDPETGALRALKDYRSRSTRLSQQLAFRITLPKTGQHWVDRQAPVDYSVMAADSVKLTQNGKVFAEITSQGRLLALNGEVVGEFEQTYQATRGSRVLVVETNLTTVPELMLDDPWDSYYAYRFAFGDESAILRAGSHLQADDVSRRRFEAPMFVEIDCGRKRTAILTGGLPFHRRVTDARLDTLLAVRGMATAKTRIGIGIDLPSPTRAAIDFITSAEPARVFAGAFKTDSGWFFHIDARNVIVPWWQPLGDNEGIRLRLIETEKRKSIVRIQSFKPWREAYVVDGEGKQCDELEIDEDGVAVLTVDPHWIAELRLHW